MPVTLGSNIAALGAQRKLAQHSDERARVFERLASGQRINHASDDAAGLAVSTALRADSRVFTQAMRNVGDGMSLLAVADGALQELSNIVARQLELAEQAANGIYSIRQRQALDREAQALYAEYNRITATTSFNGLNVFDADRSLQLQAGYGSSAILEVQLGSEITTLRGDGTFQQALTSAALTSHYEVASGDFNQDGRDDVVAAGSSSTVFALANADGTLGAASTVYSGGGTRDPKAVDVNGDGLLDILVGRTVSDNFFVYLGNGNGTFKAASTYTSGDGPLNLQIGYIDGDSNLDVMISHRNSTDITIFSGNGDGSFKAATTYTAIQQDLGASLVDVNGDGKLDLQLGKSAGGGFGIALGNGNGTFGPTVAYSGTFSSGPMPHDDFNEDGVVDLLVPGLLYLGNGDGSFKAGMLHTLPATTGLTIADFNTDGFSDFGVLTAAGNQMLIGFGNGNGTFKASSTYATGGIGPNAITVGDTNGDGVGDIIVANYTSQNFSVLIANTTATVAEDEFSLATQADARSALTTLATVQQNISAERANVGKTESRLNIAHNTLAAMREQSTAAASRITDADVALESSELVRLSILQQSAAAVLAQANLSPQLALRLLKG
jgi:flagellin